MESQIEMEVRAGKSATRRSESTIAPVALPVTKVEHSPRTIIVNQVEVPTWMTLESGDMMMGRYCIAFTDTRRVCFIYFFLFYPSRSPTMATSMAGSGDGGDGGGEERGVTCGRQSK